MAGEASAVGATSGGSVDPSYFQDDSEFEFNPGAAPAANAQASPVVTPDVTPTQGDAQIQTQINQDNLEAKHLEEQAQEQQNSSTAQKATASVLGTVGGVLLTIWPVGTIIGGCLIIASVVLGVTASSTDKKVAELSDAAKQKKTDAEMNQAVLDMPEDAPDAEGTSGTSGTEAGNNLANMASATNDPNALRAATIEGQDGALLEGDTAEPTVTDTPAVDTVDPETPPVTQ